MRRTRFAPGTHMTLLHEPDHYPLPQLKLLWKVVRALDRGTFHYVEPPAR